MPRETWVYPRDGGAPYLKGSRPEDAPPEGGVVVIGDHEEFVSPLDGKVYSGRAGMREHNARHNVVSNRDLVGLPTYTGTTDVRSDKERRADAALRKEIIIREVNKRF